jgi:hypothetical protein
MKSYLFDLPSKLPKQRNRWKSVFSKRKILFGAYYISGSSREHPKGAIDVIVPLAKHSQSATRHMNADTSIIQLWHIGRT